MKGIALISQKSGSGKTTLATSLATQGYIEGLKTLLIDLDPQGSSYKWGKRRTIPAPTVMTAQAVPYRGSANQRNAKKSIWVSAAPVPCW